MGNLGGYLESVFIWYKQLNTCYTYSEHNELDDQTLSIPAKVSEVPKSSGSFCVYGGVA